MHYDAPMERNEKLEKVLSDINGDFLKALAEPVRLDILKFLALHGASDVNVISNSFPQDRSVISRHLSTMEKSGMLNSRKEGRHVIYSINGSSMLEQAENLYQSLKMCVGLGCC